MLVNMSAMLTGCTGRFHEIKPQSVGLPPREKPRVLLVGQVNATDPRLSEPEQAMMVHAFQLGVEKWCAEHKGLEVRKDVAATNAPASAIVLTGAITEVEKGSAAARFLVGMGAGQQRVVGDFAVNGSDGTKLWAFSARKSYLGGTGVGGMDLLKVEDLVDQLGQLVAETTDKWLRGEKIQ